MADNKYLQKVQGIVIFSLALIILMYNLLLVQHKPAFVLFLSFAMIFILLPSLKRSIKLISLSMLLVGHALFFLYGLDYAVWEKAMSLNLGLISLFAFVPIFMLPITTGGYLKSIEYELGSIQNQKTKLQFLLSLATFLLGAILNLAIMRILYPIFKRTPLSEKQIARAMLVGFTSSNVWSPYFASVAIVTQLLEVPYSNLGPFIFLLAIIHFVIGNVILFFLSREKDAAKIQTELLQTDYVKDRHHKNKIISLAVIMLAIFVVLFVMERVTNYSMVVLVSIMGLVATIVWMSFLTGIMNVAKHIKTYMYESLPKVGNEISLFVSAGFFGIIVMNTPLNDFFNRMLAELASSIPMVLLIACIILLPMVLSLIGIHQIITITLLATAISPEVIHISSLAYGVLLVAAWCHASAISPFSPVNITISIMLNQNSLRAGIKNNYHFIILSFISTVVFVYLLNMM